MPAAFLQTNFSAPRELFSPNAVQPTVARTGEEFVRNEAIHAAETSALWDSPVAAVSRDLALFTIGSPSEAFDFLCNEWPARQGSIFDHPKYKL